MHRLKKNIPALGPRSDLCVVVVTTSQCSKGEWCCFVATRPEMGSLSAMRMVQASSAMVRYLEKSMVRVKAEAPQRTMAGRKINACFRNSSYSMKPETGGEHCTRERHEVDGCGGDLLLDSVVTVGQVPTTCKPRP